MGDDRATTAASPGSVIGAPTTEAGDEPAATPRPTELYLHARRTLLPPERVRELSARRPARVAVDTAVCWAIILAVWTGAALLGTWWAIALAAVIAGNRYYALFIIGHDGMHRRLFPTIAANDRFCDLLIFGPIGAITRINNRNHLRHHQHLGTGRDPDRHKYSCLNKATGLHFAAYLTATSSVLTSVGNVFLPGRQPAPERPVAPEAPTRPSYTARDLVLLVAWQVVLIVGLTLAFGWWAYPALWLLPVFVFMFLADNLRTFAEHSYPEADAVADQHRLITNTPPWLERQLLAPFNMNYHAAHHLWPSIPYYNLRRADTEMHRADTAGIITRRGSYLAYLWRYARALPLAACVEGAVQHA